jgi:hypothetical protein
MSFTTGTRPTVITPVYDAPADADGGEGAGDAAAAGGTTATGGEETYRYLVMSMRLRG